MIREATIDFLPPLVNNGFVDLDGVLAFSFHNAGAATVTLAGMFTISSGSTFNSGMPLPNVLISGKIRVEFAAAGARRLEVATVRMKGEPFSNYEHTAQ